MKAKQKGILYAKRQRAVILSHLVDHAFSHSRGKPHLGLLRSQDDVEIGASG